MKYVETWWSGRVEQPVRVVRWGHYGTPVLVFPTAGGDAEEIDRMGLVGALWPMIEAGRIKVYSVDSHAGRAFMERAHPAHCSWIQGQYDAMVYDEVLPHVWNDCSGRHDVITAGASIGAFNAIATLCRHPDAVRAAVGMSGTYDLSRWLGGQVDERFYLASPWHHLPGLGDGWHLHTLRHRFAILATGSGDWEDPGESWHMGHLFGAKGIPNRVDIWGPEWGHYWHTWHRMLPQYLAELT